MTNRGRAQLTQLFDSAQSRLNSPRNAAKGGWLALSLPRLYWLIQVEKFGLRWELLKLFYLTMKLRWIDREIEAGIKKSDARVATMLAICVVKVRALHEAGDKLDFDMFILNKIGVIK